MPDETRRKISESTKGVPKSQKMRKKLSAYKTGRPLSETARQKLRQRRPSMLGRKHSDATKRKMRESAIARGQRPPIRSGAAVWNWKGGISGEDKLIRNSAKFKELRKVVFKRDGYKCVLCGHNSRGTRPPDIHLDHIKAFALYPELRFALTNCRTLCVPCHKKTANYGYKTRRP